MVEKGSTTLSKKINEEKNMQHVTRDMRHMVGGEHPLKVSAYKLLRFGLGLG